MEKRIKLVNEIFEHAKVIDSNITTLLLHVAMLTDRRLIRFHKEYLKIKKFKFTSENDI